ncbi:hypothetical protein HO173_008950 [Letharia columbiana]|uniref:Uncharacterized protein n=1 Tax=Letharia columbiana TaxID=112416 RepID=A0A8H6FQG1_9LECA|nr:uncharacterized protein HO173_008950 [Letharia columbiana]KAF6232736.1 hypothetical protein HO173_008950 [Letharia columbiana]
MTELGRYKEQLATSVSFERGMLLRRLTAGMTPEGIVGLKFLGSETNNLGIDREFALGNFDGEVPLGQLATEIGDGMKGLKAEIARDGRIIGLGLLEKDSSSTISSSRLDVEPSPNPLWYPTIPPITWTSTMAPSLDTDFTYLHHTTFASDPQSLKHLTHLCVFSDVNPPGIYGLQFHFDDRGPIPALSPSPGKGVSFMINGIRGECIAAIQTFYSERSQSAGLTIFTSQGRQANFSTTDVVNDTLLQKHVVDEYSYAAGIMARVVVKGDRALPYQNLGFLCAPGTQNQYPKSSKLSLDRMYDDNHNVWIENEKPHPDFLLSEFIGSQSSHGFINWITLDKPISRITACLLTGKRNFRGEEAPPALTGVKFDTTSGSPMLLGRCTSFGLSIDLENADKIVEFSIGLQISERSRSIQEIMFIFKSGIRKGLRADRLIEDHECQHRQVLRSGTSCDLVGLVWSFDLGPAYIGDQGVQGLYRLNANQPKEDFMPTIYPSVNWSKPPPPNLQLRPIPCSKVHSHRLHSSLRIDDDYEALLDSNLTSIKVYFNAFLQGLTFHYANGTSRILGNTVGAEESLELHDERIIAVYITSYVQRLPNMSLPRDTMAIGAIRFCLVENTSSEPKVRYTRHAGSPSIFGPFTNQQRGLWQAEGGGSANWRNCFPLEETCIQIESNTSFAGLWAEVVSTHIHRLGVLVSFSNPLTLDHVSQPHPTIESRASSHEEEMPGSWLARPPPAHFEQTSLLGHDIKAQDHRMWCHLLTQPSRVVIYRHAGPHGIVVVGIEFLTPTTADDPERATTLLGFRSLWTEHAITLQIKEEQKIIGIGVKANQPSQWRSGEQGLGLESVRIWVTGGVYVANGHDEGSDGWLDATCSHEEQLEGFVVAFGEYMQAIGLLTSR